MLDVNGGRAPSRKKPNQVQMQYRSAVYLLSPSGTKRNAQVLILEGSDSDALGKIETSLVTTVRSKISIRLKQKANYNYHENIIDQHDCFRDQIFVLNLKALRPTQSTTHEDSKHSLKERSLSESKQQVSKHKLKFVTRKTTRIACHRSQTARRVG